MATLLDSLNLLNPFLSARGVPHRSNFEGMVAQASNNTPAGSGPVEGIETGGQTTDDDHAMAAHMFHILADDSFGTNAWENAQVLSDAGESIGRIEDMVIRADGSDAGFKIRLTRPGDDQSCTVFVSVDDLETRGAQFVWKTSPDFDHTAELPAIEERQFVSVSRGF